MNDEKEVVAGDVVAETRVAATDTPIAGDAIAEKREEVSQETVVAVTAAEQSAPIVIPDVQDIAEDVEPKFDGLRCSTCREIKKDDQLMKQPLEYEQKADGSIRVRRYSLFCGKCQQFLCIYDPVARKEIEDMITNRNNLAKKTNG